MKKVKLLSLQNISDKVHKSVRMSSTKGFSLIEMMVVLALIGLLISMVAPRFSRRSPSSDWKVIISELNNFTQFARQESVAEQVVFRLNFLRGKNKAPDCVVIEHWVGVDKKGNQEFAQVSSPYMKTRYEFAENVRVKAVYLGKQELYIENGQAFCFVVPEGLVQDVYIQLVRTEEGKEDFVTLKMRSFEGAFELIERLVRPGQEGA